MFFKDTDILTSYLTLSFLCSEALKGMSLKMSEINSYLLKMIMEGYGPQHSVDLESMKCGTYVRFNKYIVSGNGGDEKAKRFAHTDRNSLTILCDNGVQALQVLSKTGKWIEVNIPQDGFVVIIGDALKVKRKFYSFDD